MTKRDKFVMLASALLAACVVAGAVSSWVFSGRSQEDDPETFVLTGGLILIGLLSVAFVYYAKVRKRKHEKRLNDSYFQEFEIIMDAVSNSQLPGSSKREIHDDVLDMLLSAQEDGKKVMEVVGHSSDFSREIIRSFSKPHRLAILSICDGVMAFALFAIGVNTLTWLEQADKSFFAIGTDIGMIVFLAIIAFVLIPVVKRLTSGPNPWMFMLPLAFGIAYVVTSEILRAYFYGSETVKRLLDGTVAMIPNMAAFMSYLLSIPILIGIKARIRKQMTVHPADDSCKVKSL